MAAAGTLAGTATLICIFATTSSQLAVAAVFAALAARLRREIAVAHACLEPGAPNLIAGPATLAGTVEADAPPLTVTITADSRPTIEARPFLLRLASGTAIRVDPGPAPILRDTLDDAARDQPRTATLSPGERVHIRGTLRIRGVGSSAQLAGSERYILEPPPRRPMLLSTEALSGELERRASEHEFRTTMLLISVVLCNLPYLDTWYESALYLLALGPPPKLDLDFYFWILVISGSTILGAIASAIDQRPWHRRRKPS